MPTNLPKLPKRVALYTHVSRLDQDHQTQRQLLRAYAQHRGFLLVGDYIDQAAGGSQDRPQYRRLMEAVRHRRIDVVLVWRYACLARSTQALLNALVGFQQLQVDFIAYQDQMDTTMPGGELIFQVMASLAHFERLLLSERVRADRARTKAAGKRLARPQLEAAKQALIRRLYEQGQSRFQISKQTGISYSTVYKYTKKPLSP